MLSYAPVGYIDLSNVREISSLADGETAVISVALDRDPVTVRLRGGIGMVSLYCSDATEKIRISYFNQTYRAKQFTKGYSFMFYGKINRSRGASMTNPMCIKEGEGIIPVYKTVAGVSQTNLRDIAKKASAAKCRKLCPTVCGQGIRSALGNTQLETYISQYRARRSCEQKCVLSLSAL